MEGGLSHDTRPDENGVEHAEIPFATPGGTDNVYALPTQALPIVFLPGIMGSTLIATGNNRGMWKNQGRWAWNPDGKMWMLRGFRALSAAQRRQLLNPAAVRAAESPLDADMDMLGDEDLVFGLTPREASLRGWGSTMVGSYAPVMSFLETNLRRIMQRGRISESTETARPASRARWGQLRGYARLTDAEIAQAAEWRFPVYAVGYNWLASNGEAAAHLRRKVEDIRKDCRDRLNLECDKVILVTHSMGGLVARRYAQRHPDDVLGIVHGVQPAIGAGAAYARVRAGWESPKFRWGSPLESTSNAVTSHILGANGREVSAIFGNAPGPLELLPTRQYGTNWLVVEDGEGANRKAIFSVPRADPYAEIYSRSDVWWRLMHPGVVNPSDPTQQGMTAAWAQYLRQLTVARQFHATLGEYYHPQTYAHCGADVDQKAWHTVIWHLQPLREFATGIMSRTPRAEAIMNARLTGDRMTGHCDLFDASTAGDVMVSRGGRGVTVRSEGSPYRAHLGGPNSDGDGTVPSHSGVAPRLRVPFFAQMRGFDHQGSYTNAQVQEVTLYSILKIAARAESLQ
ncbi:hypothetical protein AMB3_0821 [plant metagenome]